MDNRWSDPRYAQLVAVLDETRAAVDSPRREGRSRCRKCTPHGSGWRFMVGPDGQIIRFACQRCNPGG
ncbi:hypothetical protein [Streptomyces sp. NPDC101115]|uniref:hypothetical protein n=1 Tax=Streptomyces sp. NPDC101115 TaxID=3366106 RepID=UPI0037F603B3